MNGYEALGTYLILGSVWTAFLLSYSALERALNKREKLED
jgi:hypothetical protein